MMTNEEYRKELVRVEKWSKEHPKHYYVSQLEYDILRTALDYEFIGFDCYWLGELVKKGYFEGATLGTNILDYFNHCEVVDKWNIDNKRRK